MISATGDNLGMGRQQVGNRNRRESTEFLCPAWKTWGTATRVKPNTIILHSRADDVVPFLDSEELVANSGLPPSALVEVGTEHRLAEPDALGKMLEVVEAQDS